MYQTYFLCDLVHSLQSYIPLKWTLPLPFLIDEMQFCLVRMIDINCRCSWSTVCLARLSVATWSYGVVVVTMVSVSVSSLLPSNRLQPLPFHLTYIQYVTIAAVQSCFIFYTSMRLWACGRSNNDIPKAIYRSSVNVDFLPTFQGRVFLQWWARFGLLQLLWVRLLWRRLEVSRKEIHCT